jgi:hypothetical protein
MAGIDGQEEIQQAIEANEKLTPEDTQIELDVGYEDIFVVLEERLEDFDTETMDADQIEREAKVLQFLGNQLFIQRGKLIDEVKGRDFEEMSDLDFSKRLLDGFTEGVRQVRMLMELDAQKGFLHPIYSDFLRKFSISQGDSNTQPNEEDNNILQNIINFIKDRFPDKLINFTFKAKVNRGHVDASGIQIQTDPDIFQKNYLGVGNFFYLVGLYAHEWLHEESGTFLKQGSQYMPAVIDEVFADFFNIMVGLPNEGIEGFGISLDYERNNNPDNIIGYSPYSSRSRVDREQEDGALYQQRLVEMRSEYQIEIEAVERSLYTLLFSGVDPVQLNKNMYLDTDGTPLYDGVNGSIKEWDRMRDILRKRADQVDLQNIDIYLNQRARMFKAILHCNVLRRVLV